MSQVTAYPGPMAPAPVNVSEVLEAAASGVGVLWIDTGEGTHAAWYAWIRADRASGRGGTAYLVNGPGEQHLPWLPAAVTVVLRDPGTGGRALRVRATRQVLTDADTEWEVAVAALRARRIGPQEDVAKRWRETCTITALRPFGEPLEHPAARHAGLVTTTVRSWRQPGG